MTVSDTCSAIIAKLMKHLPDKISSGKTSYFVIQLKHSKFRMFLVDKLDEVG